MLFPGLEAERPVAYWRPYDGLRHGMSADEIPKPGQQRQTLCGERIDIIDASEIDWLAPTCEQCWQVAVTLRNARVRGSP